MRRGRIKGARALLAALALLLAAPSAGAQVGGADVTGGQFTQDATQQGYAPPVPPPAGVAGEQFEIFAPPLEEVAELRRLPVTGFDLALLVVGSIVLVGLGLGMRRLSSERS